MVNEKIVVIDDDPSVIKAVRMILTDYTILEFHSGPAAVAFLQKPRDVLMVLLDVFMKDVNGLDILREIKQANRDMVVVIMTAFGSKDILLEALRGHADDFLEKPFDVPTLRSKVRAVTKQRIGALGGDKVAKRVERIKRMVEHHAPTISLEQIAEEMCLSPKYLSRMFREQNVHGFRTYRRGIRMEMAKTLLTESTLTVNQIAQKLGYHNAESFMRLFKRIHQSTPSEYRGRHGKKGPSRT